MSVAAAKITGIPRIDQSTEFMDAVRPILPALRTRARRLTGNLADSDDLVQDTLTRAWRARSSFQPGSNFRAWLMRIERNSFLSSRRREWRQVTVEPEVIDRQLSEAPSQDADLHMRDLDRAVARLPKDQREAYMLMRGGDRYDRVAEQLGIPEGTLKSRVSRARSALIQMIESGGQPIGTERQSIIDLPGPSRYEKWKRSGSGLIG